MNEIDQKFSDLLKLFADVRDDKQQRGLYNAALDLQEAWRTAARKIITKQTEANDAEGSRLDKLADSLRVDPYDTTTEENESADHDAE